MTPFRIALLAALIGLAVAWLPGQFLTAEEKTPSPLTLEEKVAKGKQLYSHSCRHCHGTEADGEGEDGGADLRGLRLSHARIAGVIRNGIKDEMPSFRKKYDTTEVDALVAYLRTLPAP